LDGLDLVRDALLNVLVRREQVAVLPHRRAREAARLPAKRRQLTHRIRGAAECASRSLPVDVAELSLLAATLENVPEGPVSPSRVHVLVGLVDLGFRRGCVLVVSRRSSSPALVGRRLRQWLVGPSPTATSPRLPATTPPPP